LTTLGEKREKVAVYAWKFGVDGRRNGNEGVWKREWSNTTPGCVEGGAEGAQL
jgi:hypothetical protein